MLSVEIKEQISKLPAESKLLIEVILSFYEARVSELEAKNVSLETRVRELEDRLAKLSHNSNKPPSSDPPFTKPSPKSLRQRSGRKAGGQKGHKGSTLKQVSTPDEITLHRVICCRCCHHDLSSTPLKRVEKRQVFDIPPLHFHIHEHRSEIKVCPKCKKATQAHFPEGVDNTVQYGPRARGLMAYLLNYQMLPFQRAAEVFEDLLSHRPSVGTLFNTQKSAHQRLSRFAEDLKTVLRAEPVLGFDETGVRSQKRLWWLHSASARYYVAYHLHRKRGQQAMKDIGILPEFRGIALHDFWSSYFHFDCQHALCIAHLLRELIFIKERYAQLWAEKLIKLFLEMKAAVEDALDKGQSTLAFSQLRTFRKSYHAILQEGFAANANPPPALRKNGRIKKPKPLNLLERLRDYQSDILRFITDFRVPFDNNASERDLRMMKVKQKIAGCFRNPQGAAYFARIRSFIGTARKQGINAFIALEDLFSNNLVADMLIQGPNGPHMAE